MAKQVSKTKVKNFRKKIFDLLQEELELRAKIKKLYEQFVLDADNDPMAIRHVRQAYFSIQKYRVQKLMADRMEFHPFFTIHPLRDGSDLFEENDEDDGII
jgi:hypothetical protein